MQSKTRQNKFRVFSIALALLAAFNYAKAATVSLGWSASSDTNVVAYNIYYGTASGDYTSETSVGNVSNVTVSNLTAGTTYYFAATALDASGNESGFSTETIYIVPGLLTLGKGANPGDPMVINFPVAPGHWYEVQASVDLQSWSTIYQTEVESSNDVVQFSDPNASAFPSRFYRLVLH
jgi:Fibronectin type III domain